MDSNCSCEKISVVKIDKYGFLKNVDYLHIYTEKYVISIIKNRQNSGSKIFSDFLRGCDHLSV